MQSIPQSETAFYQPDPEHVAHNRRGLWIAAILEVAGLLLFVVLFNLFDRLGDGLDGFGLILLGLLMSLVPALLWLTFFHRLDRLEPEPKHKLLAVFVVAGLATGAVVIPLLDSVFQIDRWLYSGIGTQLLGGILLVGFIEEGIVYLTVRYAIYGDPEFDERVDGVIYAMAAGLGLATVLNFLYVIEHGGVDLGIGSVRIVVTSLAHASFAGVLGYFIGQARFEKTPPLYLPAGLALAALLNGVFFLLEDQVSDAGLTVNPWNSLLLATAVAVVVFGLVFWLVNRANEETLRVAARQRRQRMTQAATAALTPPAQLPATQSAEIENRAGDGTEVHSPERDDEERTPNEGAR